LKSLGSQNISGEYMEEQENANVTECLKDMVGYFNEMDKALKQKDENIVSLFELFLNISEDDTTLHTFTSNKSLRSKLKHEIKGMIDLIQKESPAYEKRFQLFQTQCTLLVKMIEQANKEGIKII
jgi:hypothetical protein